MDVALGTTFVDMYAKCGSIDNAWEIFSKLPEKDVMTWTALISVWQCVDKGRRLWSISMRCKRMG